MAADGSAREGVRVPGAELRLLVSLLDLTSLDPGDTSDTVRVLCARAVTSLGLPAAVCVLPEFVGVARAALEERGVLWNGGRGVRVATVANFPGGAADVPGAAGEVRAAVARGAHEVDVVFPWRAFLAGDADVGRELVAACAGACADASPGSDSGAAPTLKVILETGELRDPGRIRGAARIAADAGAAFLKTSTGKVPVGATPEAVDVLLEVAGEFHGQVGVKISGGVRAVDQARGYLRRVEAAMGRGWIGPDRVRFGASSLLDQLLSAG